MKVKIYRASSGIFKVIIAISNDSGYTMVNAKMFQGPFLKLFEKRLARRVARMVKLFNILESAAK